jgi:predicted unusual protein kinase regulating ubiquinone biosynthesis (AarF/ABC1/UbiB family)
MDARAMAREVSDRIGEEVDYRVEAANQQEFAEAYRGHPFIRVPEVLPELSTRRVLTMELSDGVRYAKALSAEQSLRDAWGEAIYRFLGANLLLRGLFNADPHPGNYLFHPDGSVTFLDFGCVKRFTAQQVANMEEIVAATVSRDADRLMSALLSAGFIDRKDPPAAEAMLAAMVDSRADLMASQPYTYTPESSAEALRTMMSPRGPHGALMRKLSGGSDYIFITRVDTGMTTVLGGLHATGPWWAIRQEYSSGAPPATPYGELDLAHRSAAR